VADKAASEPNGSASRRIATGRDWKATGERTNRGGHEPIIGRQMHDALARGTGNAVWTLGANGERKQELQYVESI